MPSPENILFSFIFGAIGLAALGYGRSTTQPKLMIIGAALLGYPYFVSSTWLVFGIGVALSASLWWAAE